MSQVARIKMSPQGPEFSQIVQGYWRMNQWQMSAQQCLSFLKQHVELGITTVDHAHVYGNPSCESLFGEVLKLDSGMRQRLEIVSKCGIELADYQPQYQVPHYNSSASKIIQSVNTSLSRLAVDELDVLLLHRPDYLLDADEIADVFLQLRQSGKVKHFGVSNFSAAQFELLQSRLDFALVTNQIELNPLNLSMLESGVLEQLQRLKIRPMAWSCLGGGKILSDDSDVASRLRIILKDVADEIGADNIEQVLFAWVLRLPVKAVPIVGSGKIERIVNTVDALNYSLNHEQWYRIWVAAKGHNVP